MSNEHPEKRHVDGCICVECVREREREPKLTPHVSKHDEEKFYGPLPVGDLQVVLACEPQRLSYTADEMEAVVTERDQARKAILSFGGGNGFDWGVLGKIDELEKEIERLRGELSQLQRKHAYVCTTRDNLISVINSAGKEHDQLNRRPELA